MLEAAAREAAPATLRFFSWEPPAVSLGRFQTLEGIDTGYARERGWDVVRRPTGGRGVVHHLELTYSIALPPSVLGGAGVRTSYHVLTGLLNTGLQSLIGEAARVSGPAGGCASRGQANCFALASECDAVAGGGKLVGSAQVRRGGALLQHGSILLDAEPDAWARIFGTAGGIVTLRELLGYLPSPNLVVASIIAALEDQRIRLHPGELTAAEMTEAQAGAAGFQL